MKYTLVDSFQVPLTEQICQQEMKRIPGNNTNGWNDIEQHGTGVTPEAAALLETLSTIGQKGTALRAFKGSPVKDPMEWVLAFLLHRI